MFLYISFHEFTSLSFQNPEAALKFIGGTVIPIFSMNLLATYLAYRGGATASITYMSVLFAFEWFSPISPNPHWAILAFIRTIAPAIGFLIMQESKESLIKRSITFRRKAKMLTEKRWTIIAVFTVFLIFFSYGYFGVKPTVIYSGSMSPEFNVGDLVIIDNVDKTLIKKGDVIQFISSDNEIFIHRVIDIQKGELGSLFLTKGDANKDADPKPLKEDQILGKAIFTIPFIGWIQIYLRHFFNTLMGSFRK